MNVVHPGGVHRHASGMGGGLNEGPATTTRHHHSSRASMHVEPSLEFSMDSNTEFDEDGFRLYEKQPRDPRVVDPAIFSSSTNKAKGTPSKPKLPISTPRMTKKASVTRASTGSSSGAPGGGVKASESTKISTTTRAETAPVRTRTSTRTPRPKTRSTSRSRPVATVTAVDTTTTTAVVATTRAATETNENAAIPSHSKRSSTGASRKKRPASHPREVATRRKSTMEDVSSKSAPEALEVQQKRQRNRSRSSSKDRARKGTASSGMSKSEQHHFSRRDNNMSGSDKGLSAAANGVAVPSKRSSSSSRGATSKTRRSKEAQQMNAPMPVLSLNASANGTVDSGSGSRARLRGSSKTRAHSAGRRKQQQPHPSESASPRSKKQVRRPSEPGLPQKSFPKNASRSMMQLNLPPTHQTRVPPPPSKPIVQQAPEPPPTPPSSSSSRARQATKRPLSAPANRSKLKFNPNSSMPAFTNLHADTAKNNDSDDGMYDNSARRPRTRRASTSQLIASKRTTTTTVTTNTTNQTASQPTAQSHPRLKPTPVVRKPLKTLANKARQAWQDTSMHSRASFATRNTDNNNKSMDASSDQLDDYQHGNLGTTEGHTGDEAERDDDDPDYIRATVVEKAAQIMATKKQFATEKAKWWKMKKRLSFTSGPLGGGKGEKKSMGMGGSSGNNNLMSNSSSNNSHTYQPPTIDAAQLIVDHRRRPPPSVSDTSTNADDSMRASVTPSMQSLDQRSHDFVDSLGHLSSSDDSDGSDDDYDSNDDDTSSPSEDVESMQISAVSLPNMMNHSSSELMEKSASSMPNMNRSFGDSRIQPSNSLLGGDSGEDDDDDGVIPQKRSKSEPLLPKKKKSKASKIKSKITKGMKKKKKVKAKQDKYQDAMNNIDDGGDDASTDDTNHKRPNTVEVDMEKQDSVSIYNDSFRSSNTKQPNSNVSLSLGESNHTSKPSLAASSLAKSMKTAPTMPHGGIDPLALRHDSPEEPSPLRITNSVHVLADFLDQYDDMDALFSLGLEDAAAAQQQEKFDKDAMTIGQQSQLTEVSNGSPVDDGDISEPISALSKASKTPGKKAKRKSRASIVLKRFIKNFDDMDGIVQEDEDAIIGSLFTEKIDEEDEQPKRNSKIKVTNTPAAYKAKAMAGGDIFDVLETPDAEDIDDGREVEADTPKKKKKSRASFVFKKFMKNFDELDILFSKGKGNEESNHQSFGHKSDTMAAHNTSGMFSMGSTSSYSRKSLPTVLDNNNGAVDPHFEEDKSLDEVSMPDNPSPPQPNPHPLPETNILKEMLEMSEEDLKSLFAKEKATETASQDIHNGEGVDANNVVSSFEGSSPDNEHSNGSSEDDILSKISEEPSTGHNRRSLTSADLAASSISAKESPTQRGGRHLLAESLTMEDLISPELEDDTDDEGDDSKRKMLSQSMSCINERGPARSAFEVRNNLRKKSPVRRRIERSSSPSPRPHPRVKRVLSEASGMSLAELESQNDGSNSGRLGRRNLPSSMNEAASKSQPMRSFSVPRGDQKKNLLAVDSKGAELTPSQAKLHTSFNGFSNFQRSFSPRARPRQKIISENAAGSPVTPKSGRRLPVRQVRSGRGDSMFRRSLPDRIDLLVDSPSDATKRRLSQPDEVRKSLLERRQDFEGLLNIGLEDAAAPVTTNQLEVDQEAIEDMKAVKARSKKEQDNLIQQFNRRAIQRSTSKKRSTSADNPRESAAARRARDKSPVGIRRVGSQGMMSSGKQSPARAPLSAKKTKGSEAESRLASMNTGVKPLSESVSGDNENSGATSEAHHGIAVNRVNAQNATIEAHGDQERISLDHNTSYYSDDATSEASSPYIIDPSVAKRNISVLRPTAAVTGFSSEYRLSSSIRKHEPKWEDFADQARQRAMQSVPWRNTRGLSYHVRETQEAKTQKVASLQLDDTFHWRHYYDGAKKGSTKSYIEFSRGKPLCHRHAEGVLYNEEKEQDIEPCHRGRAVQGNFDAGISNRALLVATDEEDDASIVYPEYNQLLDRKMDRRASGDSITSFA